MTYLFFIQGEGRGHLTQALALKEKLQSRGHQVAAVVVSLSRELPSFFKEQIACPFFTVPGPRFAVDKNNQGINISKSILLTIQELPLYWQSIKKIKKIIAEYQPDVLVNFYEPLVSQYRRFYRDKRPMVSLGHQYFISHPESRLPNISYFAKQAFYFYNWLTAGTSDFKIALSFTDSPDQPTKKLFICPPLIRSTIKNQTTTQEPFILAYLLNAGYSAEIITWCQKNPQQRVEAFWDKAEKNSTAIGSNLIFHPLSGQKFIDRLAACQAYVSTAGFDSIAEAAYLQKNIVMIPTKNHFEQKYNALDAERAGLASSVSGFHPSLSPQKNPFPEAGGRFQEWVNRYDNKIINLLEKVKTKI